MAYLPDYGQFLGVQCLYMRGLIWPIIEWNRLTTTLDHHNVFCKTILSVFRYSDTLELEDAVHTAILTLKESFEGQMTEDNIEIGISNSEGFKRLTPSEVKDYLAAIA